MGLYTRPAHLLGAPLRVRWSHTHTNSRDEVKERRPLSICLFCLSLKYYFFEAVKTINVIFAPAPTHHSTSRAWKKGPESRLSG